MSTYDTWDALADPTRRRVFELLRGGPLAVQRIAEQLPVSRPAVSQHLRVLSAAGLVTFRRDGARRLYTVNRDGLAGLRWWLDTFWDDALARFKEAAERERSDDE